MSPRFAFLKAFVRDYNDDKDRIADLKELRRGEAWSEATS